MNRKILLLSILIVLSACKEDVKNDFDETFIQSDSIAKKYMSLPLCKRNSPIACSNHEIVRAIKNYGEATKILSSHYRKEKGKEGENNARVMFELSTQAYSNIVRSADVENAITLHDSEFLK